MRQPDPDHGGEGSNVTRPAQMVRWRRRTCSEYVPGLLLAGTVAGVVWSCGGSGARHDAFAVDTLANGRVVVSNPDPARSGTADAFRLVEDLRIGAAVGAGTHDPFVFGAIVSLAVDERGNIFVADSQWREIRVFGPEGDFLHSIGGPGEGPGEFSTLDGATFVQATGVLWTLDYRSRKITAFDRDGRFLADHAYGERSLNAETVWRAHADTTGHLYRRDPDSGFDHLLRHATSEHGGLLLSDSLLLPVIDVRLHSSEYEFGMASSPVPMSPELHWAVGPDGGVWLGRSDTFRIHKVALSGDTVRTVELLRAPELLQGRERDSVAAAAGLSSGMLPRHKPVMGIIAVAPNSWLWVAVAEEDHLQAWDLFDDAGRYRGRATSPEPMALTPTPLVAADVVLGVVEDEFGGQSIVRLRVLPTS